MSVKYKILDEYNLCIDNYFGIVKIDDIITLAEKQILDKEYLSVKKLLIDTRKITKGIFPDTMPYVIEKEILNKTTDDIQKIAIISSSPESFVFSFFYRQQISANKNVKLETFQTIEQALHFLELKNEIKIIEKNNIFE